MKDYMMKRGDILVTGAYGYIGAHICKEAYENGFNIYAIDINTSKNNISKYCKDIKIVDIRKDAEFFQHKEFFEKHFDAVIHCAALISIEESVEKPHIYYDTNVNGVLKTILHTKCDNFIFASTGGAFDPISPYSKSKLIAEHIVKTMCSSFNIFRFFNVAGNNGEFGQICKPSHIMHIAAQVAAGKRDKMVIFGKDYNTFDGSCVRDYVHVQDLAEAIVRSIYKPLNSEYECVGSGSGYSNIEVVDAMKKASGQDFKVEFGERRKGDPDFLKVDRPSEFVEIKRSIEDMCYSAYLTEMKNG
jgi:UDP-glucose 4-epimerase